MPDRPAARSDVLCVRVLYINSNKIEHGTIGWWTNSKQSFASLVGKSGHVLYGGHVIPAGQPFSRNVERVLFRQWGCTCDGLAAR
jgi:hypothetical protein